MPSNPTLFPYCFIFVAWLIELGKKKKKMVIVRARVASSQTRFSPTMTLYSTMIPGYCRVQLKKKWQTCHQVPRCWPHSTVCWSPGHGIGRPGLMVTSHITDRISGTWATCLMLPNRGRGHFRFWKRTWRHPRWWTEAEMPPAPVRGHQTRSLYYWAGCGKPANLLIMLLCAVQKIIITTSLCHYV